MEKIKKVIITCSDSVLSEHETIEDAWQAEPSSACYVVDFENGQVWSPVIENNTWFGNWKLASPLLTEILLQRFNERNPLQFNYVEIRRRTIDALRKTKDFALLLEIARRLNVPNPRDMTC